jgi:mycothiol synthase
MSSSHWQVETTIELTAADVDEVAVLASRARDVDGVAPLNEHSTLQLHGNVPGVTHLLARAAGTIVGYAQLEAADAGAGDHAPASMELVVAPAQRRHGLGTGLASAAVTLAAGRPLLAWAHGTTDGAVVLAARAGFLAVRSLLQLGRALVDVEEPPEPPAGIRIRTFVPGRDEDAWLAVNAAAFVHHPEQGRWTGSDLAAREAEDWFDPAGFFLAETDTSPARVVGFHWTKVEGGSGEVYVVGIDPSAQGGGLGKLLLLTGLRYLANRGCTHVDLYVESDNTAARALYERRGFTVEVTDTMYRREP